jgi:hypothetical protein
LKPAKIFLFLCNYVYPFIGFPALIWLWLRDSNLSFAVLVIGLPFVFGYLIPGIGTNYLKMWRFHGPWVVGNYFIHHGFIYSSTMGLGLYLAFFPLKNLEVWNILGNMARTACILGFVGWAHDLVAVREGMIEVFNGPWKRGASPETIVSHSIPLCYVSLGAAYCGIASLGYQVLVVQPGNSYQLLWLFPLGLTVMAIFTSMPYLMMDPR